MADAPSSSTTSLVTTQPLTMGRLSYKDARGNSRSLSFQFNPTEIERSRTISFTRTPTGNTVEEPGVGPRDQPKRKASRKPEPWTMTLSLRYDASYPRTPGTALESTLKEEVTRVAEAMSFFQELVEPGAYLSENENISNAHETSPPPWLTLVYGYRSWQCAVKSLRIKELAHTIDLYVRNFEVALTLELFETTQQIKTNKSGAQQS